MNKLTITANVPTYLKKEITQSTNLSSDKKVQVKAGRTYDIISISEIAESGHAFVNLDFEAGDWFIYLPHWEVDYKKCFSNPDIIDWEDMTNKISKYFTVGEFLRYDTSRIPRSKDTQRAIFRLSQELDKIREAWGSPLIITSGYRPPTVNASVGGNKNSRHLVGDAVDLAPLGAHNLKFFESWLDHRWYGALGYGAHKGFVHLDMRNNKGFLTGGDKGPRWNYS